MFQFFLTCIILCSLYRFTGNACFVPELESEAKNVLGELAITAHPGSCSDSVFKENDV